MKSTLIKWTFGFLFTLFFFQSALAQTDSTQTDEEDYSQYGSAEESVKYATQKVRLLSPTRLVSVGFEMQAPFDAEFTSREKGSDFTSKHRFSFLGGARWQANAPVISTNRLILNLGASYYESFLQFDPETPSEESYFSPYLRSGLDQGLRTTGISATAFKPLDEKRFLILAAQGDFNGNFGWNTLASALPAPTLTFAALYGWKKNENTMMAFGATQTWRGGERIYVPLFMFNRTFSDKWGLEMLLPARAHLRYNFSPQSLLLGGFEIEGNSYRIMKGDSPFQTRTGTHDFLELRRSELKFRLQYDQRLFGFVWLSIQAGWRYNYKFDFSESQSSDRGDFLIESKLGNPLYGGISLNLVSP